MTDRDETQTPTSDPQPHETSLAIWDVPSPLVLGRLSKMKVGVRCSSGCVLTSQKVQVLNGTQQLIGEGELGPAPWPGTTGLYWAEIDVLANAIEGTHMWTARFATPHLDVPHLVASSNFTISAVKPPEHRVTVEVVQQDTNNPIDVSEVRLGIYRTVTDATGVAHLELPKGTYELNVWKLGFDLVTQTVEVSQNLTLKLQLRVAAESESPYWMG
jgi:hypothetical protein